MVRIAGSLLLTLLLVATLGTAAVSAADGMRSISFYTDFTSISISQGDDITLYVNISNTGEIAEDIDLGISTPKEWIAAITANSAGSAQVQSVHLEPESDAKRLTFKCTPASDVAEGEYTITLTATSADSQIQRSIDLDIDVIAGDAVPVGPASVNLSINYPSLEGEPGSALEYKVDVTNNSSENQTFDFAAEIPQYFEIDFSPSIDRNKIISSLEIEANSSQGIIVKVTPGQAVEEGEYSIVFQTSAGDLSESIEFKAVVAGSHHMFIATRQEVVSFKATAGEERHVSMVVVNDGTAPLNDISLSAPRVPEGWDVEFKPETIPYLEPQTAADIDMVVKPKGKAISGDYIVVARAREAKSPNADAEFRITVESSDSYLWIAIVIIVVILAVLLGIFLVLRRR